MAGHFLFTAEAERAQNLLNQLQRVCRYQTQGVTDLVGQAGILQADFVVARILVRTVPRELAAGKQAGREWVGARVSGGLGCGGDGCAVHGRHLLAAHGQAGCDEVARTGVCVFGFVVVADGGGGSVFFVVRTTGSLEDRQHGVQPRLGRHVIVRVAFLPGKDAARSESGETFVELASAAAEIFVVAVAQRQDRVS